MQKSGHVVLKGVNCIHNDKISSNGPERSQLGTQCQKSGHMVLKGVDCVKTHEIRSNGLERSQLGTHS